MKSKWKLCFLVAVGMCAAAALQSEGRCFGRGKLEKEQAYELRLPDVLEESRGKIGAQINRALASVVEWFAQQGFQVQPRDVIDTAIVFATKKQAKAELALRFHVDGSQIPDGFSGTVDGGTLLLVSEEIFAQTFRNLYPDEKWSDDTYRQLIAHELAHRVHAILATAIFGSEEGMGPRWFFEGLAIQCAGQFDHAEEACSFPELKTIIDRDAQEALPYTLYGKLFSSLLGSFSVRELIEHAGKEDFLAFLEKRYHGI